MEKLQVDAKSDSNILSKKISKILESNLEYDKDTLEALKSLSVLVSENNLNERRNLRSKIEKQSLLVNEEFLKSFSEAKKCLDSLYDDVLSISKTCQNTMNQLKSASLQTSYLLNQTNQLDIEKKKIQAKEMLLNGFIDKFQLKPDEVVILKGSNNTTLNDDIDERFFIVLEKVKQIHEDSKILLLSNQQTTGIEIMDEMALHQEAAYERLYRWTLTNLRTITSDSVEIHSQLFKAMSYLQHREMLFKSLIDEFVIVRRAAVTRNFINCLTRGSGSSQSSIDNHSSDTVRYISDMFAWLHQAIASEKELIESLLKLCNQESLKCTKVIESALSLISEGCSRPLKIRIEQALISEQSRSNQTSSSVLHKVKEMIEYYRETINQILLKDAQLFYTIDELYTLNCKILEKI